jgi:hypothetical protein
VGSLGHGVGSLGRRGSLGNGVGRWVTAWGRWARRGLVGSRRGSLGHGVGSGTL